MNRTLWLVLAVVLLAGIAWLNANRRNTPADDTATAPMGVPFVTPPTGNLPASGTPSAIQQPAGRVNPPHGQPGHRCDLAVGAPLPGPGAAVAPVPAGPSTPTITPAPANSTPANGTPALAAGGKGKNPPHGQPGHRCDIPVGAPLDSKPPAPASITNTTTATTTSSPSPAITVAKGKNPPHGQPGHRCELPVGADFDSANAAARLKADTAAKQ
jgi:hypothetical protein